MKLATVRADGRTALAGVTDAGVTWVERIGTLRNPVRTND